MYRPIILACALALSSTLPIAAPVQADDDRSILVQSTTSTENSGLFDVLLPAFTEDSGITVHVVAVGTGQAIRNAANGDGDVLFVHAKAAEEKFVIDNLSEGNIPDQKPSDILSFKVPDLPVRTF
ncbi:MAG: substrate-binding domain-containing protein, partial [Mangrovicoccus sp.]